jgi:hypothetical protein
VASAVKASRHNAAAAVQARFGGGQWGDVSAILAAVAAMALCAIAFRQSHDVDLDAMGDFGLVSILPMAYVLAIAALSASFALSLRRPELRGVVLLAHLIVLLVMLYALAPYVEGAPRTQSTWKLAGVAEYVMSHGAVDPDIDAFFNWPGFFIAVAQFTRWAGLSNPVEYAAWAPVFFNALFGMAIYGVLRTWSSDPRLAWIGVWLFYLANWIGQDHLAPQSLSYFLFLVIVLVLVKWFAVKPSEHGAESGDMRTAGRLRRYLGRSEAGAASSTGWQRAALMAVVIVLYSATVPSHQLTPWLSLIVIGALVLARRVAARGLPMLMVLLATTWLSFMAVRYLNGHFEHVIAPVGSVNENVSANLTDRFVGNSAHLKVAYVRVLVSALTLALALIGAVRRARAGRADLTFLLLAIVPFLVLPLQSYGGELLMRAFMFALPAMVLFAAAAFLRPTGGRLSAAGTICFVLVSSVLAGGWLIARHGDERMSYFTSGEQAAVDHLYRVARPGTELISLNVSLPWRYKFYDAYRYVSLQRDLGTGPPSEQDMISYLKGVRHTGGHLIVTRAQLATGTIVGGWPQDAWARLRAALERSGVVKPVYSNRDAEIFAVVRPTEPIARSATPRTRQG